MAEWLYEAGIGEERALLIDGKACIEAHIQPEDEPMGVGRIAAARLRTGGIAQLDDGHEALLERTPPGLTEGAAITVVLTREALSERGKPKRAKARVIEDGTPSCPAPRLQERITSTNHPVRILSLHEDDALEAAGWSEMLEEAASGLLPFNGGLLRISLTPAMTLIDVDGTLPAAPLALAGLEAALKAIRRFGIGGSIGIDLPTLSNKAERTALGERTDQLLPLPFERTAINGFGFLQIIRPRPRLSLPERLALAPAGCAARALLRTAQRSGLTGDLTLCARQAVIAQLSAHAAWLETLGRQSGGIVRLQEDPSLAMSSGYVFKA